MAVIAALAVVAASLALVRRTLRDAPRQASEPGDRSWTCEDVEAWIEDRAHCTFLGLRPELKGTRTRVPGSGLALENPVLVKLESGLVHLWNTRVARAPPQALAAELSRVAALADGCRRLSGGPDLAPRFQALKERLDAGARAGRLPADAELDLAARDLRELLYELSARIWGVGLPP
jgi:hypothetical protein